MRFDSFFVDVFWGEFNKTHIITLNYTVKSTFLHFHINIDFTHEKIHPCRFLNYISVIYVSFVIFAPGVPGL